MKVIYTGWPGMRLAPNLAVEDDKQHPQYGWLFVQHPDGQMVTLANLKPLFTPTFDAAEERRKEAQDLLNQGEST